MKHASTLYENESKGVANQAEAPKLGGGSSSGLGEFWNMELAK
jgi:hypothetical protein